MATFRLGRFHSQPEILRAIAPVHLLSLLAGHAQALEAVGFRLPPIEEADAFDYDGLMSLLMKPDGLPDALREAFFFIHEMATQEGMLCLLEAAEQAGIAIEGQPAPTPGDTAVQVWLRDRELLERTHAEQFLHNPRKFESFSTATSPVPDYRDPMAIAAAIKEDLDDFFEKKKRGRNTKVFPYIRSDGVWFLVRHGDPFKREGAIDDKGESIGVYYRPERFDVIVLDPTEGELRINARNKGATCAYRAAFGRHLYGDDRFFGGDDKYTLDPLCDKGEDAIAPIEGMDEVHLIEVHFQWGGSHNEREVRKADDVFAAYAARGRKFPATAPIIKACFRVKFSESVTPRTVTIKPPNVAQFARDSDGVIVEAWLCARGFITFKERHEPADTAILASA